MAESYISNDDYHRSEGLSAGMLNALDVSPAHLWAMLNYPREPATTAMVFGTRVHRILESFAAFHDEYILRPEGIDRRTKDGKAKWAEIESDGREVVDPADWVRIHEIHKAVASADDRLIDLAWEHKGERESSIYWNHDDLVMKCRPDKLIEVTDSGWNDWLSETWPSLFNPICNRIVIDYKTMNSLPTAKSFGYRVRSKAEGGFGYGLAASHYLSGTHADAFLWIVIETSPPFTVTRFLMSPQTKAIYDNRREVLIEQYKDCREYDNWPGISITPQETML